MSTILPLPSRAPLFSEPAGRAGDWWEPISVDATQAAGLIHEAANRRLPLDLLVGLLVERELVERDIAKSGIDPASAGSTLAAAGHEPPSSGPGCLHTSYIRMLRVGDRGYMPESVEQLARRNLMLPLRLHQLAGTVEISKVCQRGALGATLGWEIAAASSGQFMREWSLRILLAAFAA